MPALELGAVMPLYRHHGSSETMVILRGEAQWIFFDESGEGRRMSYKMLMGMRDVLMWRGINGIAWSVLRVRCCLSVKTKPPARASANWWLCKENKGLTNITYCCLLLILAPHLRQVRQFYGCRHRRAGRYTTFGQWNSPSEHDNHQIYYLELTCHMPGISNTCYG